MSLLQPSRSNCSADLQVGVGADEQRENAHLEVGATRRVDVPVGEKPTKPELSRLLIAGGG